MNANDVFTTPNGLVCGVRDRLAMLPGLTAEQLDLLASGRPRRACPVCHAEHCITRTGHLWTHGPRSARCRGSRLRHEAARLAAATVRGITTIHFPEEA